MLEDLIEMGKHSIIRVVSIEKVVAPAKIRERLGLGERDLVHKVVRVLRNEEGEPYAHYVSWTVGVRKGFTKRNLESKARLDVLRDAGFRLAKVDQVLRESYDDDGLLVDVLDCLYNPKRYQFAMVLGVE